MQRLEDASSVKDFNGLDDPNGPTSTLLFGVHGDELPSVRVGQKLRRGFIVIQHGKVRTAFGNVRAIAEGKRFSEGGADLNRVWLPEDELHPDDVDSYEYRRAQFLKPHISETEVLLDVHNTSNIKTEPMIIVEPHGEEITSALPVYSEIGGFDEFEPGGTDWWMNSIGKLGICVEAGWSGDEKSDALLDEIIREFLIKRGHIEGTSRRLEKLNRTVIDVYISKIGFVSHEGFRDFQPVTLDTKIGEDGGEPIYVRNADKGNVLTTDEDLEMLFCTDDVYRKPRQTGGLVVARRNKPTFTNP